MAPIPLTMAKLMLVYNHLCLANSQDHLNHKYRYQYLDNLVLWDLSHKWHLYHYTLKQLYLLHHHHHLDSNHLCSNQT